MKANKIRESVDESGIISNDQSQGEEVGTRLCRSLTDKLGMEGTVISQVIENH